MSNPNPSACRKLHNHSTAQILLSAANIDQFYFHNIMLRLLITALSLSASSAFTIHPAASKSTSTTCLYSKKDSTGEVVNQQAFASGTFVEFVEKKRTHIGKIESVEHKSSGGARYQ